MLIRHIVLPLPTNDLPRATKAVMSAVELHKPSVLHCESCEGAHTVTKIVFEATFFGRRVMNWNALLGISRGSIELLEKTDGVVAKMTLQVWRSHAMAAAHVGFFVAAMFANGARLGALLTLAIAMPIWMLLLSEAYIGTLKKSILKTVQQAITDEPRRGFAIISEHDNEVK